MIDSLKSKINSFRSVKYKNINLPIRRSNEGLNTNIKYLDSAVEQINHLKSLGTLKSTDKILDFGCGQGRFVNGIIHSNTQIGEYYGIDSNVDSINWCNRFLRSYTSKEIFQFLHLDSYNARYNKRANGLKHIPLDQNQFDLIFLNSVFSHMLTKDIEFYLLEFHKLLKPDGIIYLTAFIEPNVPDVEENPLNYIAKSSGPLHRVRYDKTFFFELIENSGFVVSNFFHQHIKRAKQSVVVLKLKQNAVGGKE